MITVQWCEVLSSVLFSGGPFGQNPDISHFAGRKVRYFDIFFLIIPSTLVSTNGTFLKILSYYSVSGGISKALGQLGKIREPKTKCSFLEVPWSSEFQHSGLSPGLSGIILELFGALPRKINDYSPVVRSTLLCSLFRGSLRAKSRHLTFCG